MIALALAVRFFISIVGWGIEEEVRKEEGRGGKGERGGDGMGLRLARLDGR